MAEHPRPHIVIDPAMCFGASQIRGFTESQTPETAGRSG